MRLREFESMMKEVMENPLDDDEFGGSEVEYFRISKHRQFHTISLIPRDRNIKILDIGSEPGHIAIFVKTLGYDVTTASVNLVSSFKQRMSRYDISADIINIETDNVKY
ncbi:MAG TPA: hypothetical protein DCW46_08230, partial [Desulfotomaculum sp.]|nr:hypothetical protein [Desulfotomaculum sp.]